MKVSIIIPVYNAEKYLRECIESALQQTYKDIEIIAVDDGSTDSSPKILSEYSHKIKVITKENGGTASALNTGIDAMNGEWFKWLSADDELYPNAIEELMLEVNKLDDDPSQYIFYSNYDIINSKGEKVRQFIEPDLSGLSDFEQNIVLLDQHIGNGITSLIHRSLFEKFGKFDEKIGFAEDYEFWLRSCIIHKCKLHLVPKILAKYRIHETQISVTKINKAFENAESIRKMILNQLNEKQHKKYIEELRDFRKKKPISVRIRHNIRDIMLKILPKFASEYILSKYFKIKRRI